MIENDSGFYTAQVILAVAIHVLVSIVLIWDIFVSVKWGRELTVSSVLLKWSRAYPILPLMAGLLGGHIFWPQN